MSINTNQTSFYRLPAISTSSGGITEDPSSIKRLLARNGNMSVPEEEWLLHELTFTLTFIDQRVLDGIRKEMRASDPHARRMLDAATANRVFLNMHMKEMSQQVQHNLFRLFALDQKRQRMIRYEDMMDYMDKVKGFVDYSSGSHWKSQPSHETNGAPPHESHSYLTGDAKLILDLEMVMKTLGISKIDTDSIRKELEKLAHDHNGRENFLTKAEIDSVLNKMNSLHGLRLPVDNLISRCWSPSGNGYDWETFVRFLDKAQPTVPNEDDVTGKYNHKKETAELAPGYPVIATIEPIASKRAKAPRSMITHFNSEHINERELPPIQQQRNVQFDGQKYPAQKHAPNATMKRSGLTKTEKLIEEIKMLELNHHGYLPVQMAQALILESCAEHQLNFNPRFIQSAILMCTDSTGTQVNLRDLILYLSALLSKPIGTP